MTVTDNVHDFGSSAQWIALTTEHFYIFILFICLLKYVWYSPEAVEMGNISAPSINVKH